jgi:GT2 family glycosyltransferase
VAASGGGAPLPSVSVVIPTYKRRDLLSQVLAPLMEEHATSEIVVVVDGCRDGSFELIQSIAASDRRVRPRLIENRGENGARLTGVEAARGEVVLLLDDDVRAAPGLVTGHARRHAGRSGLVVVGYMPPVLSERRAAHEFPTRLYAREYESICRRHEREPEAILEDLWAGNLSMRREDCLGVMSAPEIPALPYHADRELGLRCRKAGLTGIFDRSLRADHLYERSIEGFARDARAQGHGLTALHQLHGDLLGPLPPDAFSRGLPAALRAWLRLCRRPRAGRASSVVLRGLLAAAGAAHAHRGAELSGRVLRRIEQQRGALGAG